jgi:hypothetical protein
VSAFGVQNLLVQRNIVALDNVAQMLPPTAIEHFGSIVSTFANQAPDGRLSFSIAKDPPFFPAPELTTRIESDLENIGVLNSLKG